MRGAWMSGGALRFGALRFGAWLLLSVTAGLPLSVLAETVLPPPVVMRDLTLGTSAAHAALDEVLHAERERALQAPRLSMPPAPAPMTPLQQSLHAARPANATPSPMPPVEPFGGKEACQPPCCAHERATARRHRNKAPPPSQCRCQTGPLKCPSCMSAMYC